MKNNFFSVWDVKKSQTYKINADTPSQAIDSVLRMTYGKPSRYIRTGCASEADLVAVSQNERNETFWLKA